MRDAHQRVGIVRPLLVAIIAAALVIGALSLLYLPQILNPKKITIVHVGMGTTESGCSSANGICSVSGEVFLPRNLTVEIGVNNTVQWTNTDPHGGNHTATEGVPKVVGSSGAPGASGFYYVATSTPVFDSHNVQPRGNFTYTFTQPGVYEYFCVYHAYMIGFVVVKP